MRTSLFSAAGPGEDSPAIRRLAESLLLLATFVVYVGTVDFGFVYDDRPQIILNPFLRSWRFFWRYFQRDVWSQAGRGQGSNYYRPLFLVWLRINYALFHLKPAGWHLAVVLLHLVVTWLVYRLATHLLKDWRKAAFAAAFFGLNPIHLEAVAWVSGVTEPLVAAFLLAAFLCHLRFRESPDRRWLWAVASALLYLLATLAKETAVAFPLLVAAYDWFFGSPVASGSPPAFSGSWPRAVPKQARAFLARLMSALKAAGPYLLLTLAYLYIRVLVLGAIVRPIAPMPWRDLVFTLPSVLWFYVKLLVWPAPLSIYYDLDWILHPGLANFWLPALALVLMVVALVVWSLRRPVVGMAALWTLLLLGPVLDLRVFPAGNFVQDRYLYLPSIGFSILAIELLAGLFPRRSNRARLSLAAASLAFAVLIGYAAGTLVASTYWADDTLLFYHALKVAPLSPFPKNDLGAAMMERKHYRRAVGLFRAAIAADPTFGYPWGNLALLYYKTGEYPKAVRCAEEFLRLYPDTPDGYYLLGVSDYQLGRLRQAAQYLGYALTLKPYAYGFHYALGLTLLKEGDPRGALIEFQAEPRHSTKRADAEKQIAAIRQTLRARSTAPSAAP
jgi:tetratricopeptide (TPR) repeat protein